MIEKDKPVLKKKPPAKTGFEVPIEGGSDDTMGQAEAVPEDDFSSLMPSPENYHGYPQQQAPAQAQLRPGYGPAVTAGPLPAPGAGQPAVPPYLPGAAGVQQAPPPISPGGVAAAPPPISPGGVAAAPPPISPGGVAAAPPPVSPGGVVAAPSSAPLASATAGALPAVGGGGL
ncbi:MAG: hypothetical protein O7B81_07475, partial [Gammaproteobacteria bacterium]|nr:hypothetical protein [Gammaproteobacteria bacterium]